MNLERRCTVHSLAQVLQADTSSRCYCETEHQVEHWLVVDVDTGRVVGAGSVNGGLLAAPLPYVPGPTHRCKHGHALRWLRRGLKGWKCGACSYQSQRRYVLRQRETSA